MIKFLALLKVLLINTLGISALRFKARKNRLEYLKILGLGLAVVVGVAPTIALYTKLLWEGYTILAPLGQESAIISFGTVIVSSIIFFFGIFYIINMFYLAGDTQNLLALPLRGWQVLGARFTVVLCYEYITELPFLLPPLIIFGLRSGASPVYWLYSLLGVFFIPLLPLGLVTIPIVVLLRFANLGRRKDLFKILAGIIVLALAVGLQFIFQKSGPNAMDPVFLQNMLTGRDGLMNLISRLFPSTKYLGLALINADKAAGLIALLQFIGLSFLVVVLAWLVGDKLYFQGLIGSSETTTRRKKLTKSDYNRLATGSSPLFSYCIKEIRLLIRTPIYFMNCVLINLLLPVLLVVPFWLQSRNESGPMPWEELLTQPGGETILMAAVIGTAVFLTASNAIAATSLSREGKEFYISKYLPLAYQKQIQAKLLSGYVFGGLGALLLLIAANILLPLEIAQSGIILAVSLVAIIPAIEAGLSIDIIHPRLEWDNEQKAVKQNLNVVWSMLFSILTGGGIIYLAIRFFDNPAAAALFMLVCFGMTALFLYYWLMTRGIELYKKLEG